MICCALQDRRSLSDIAHALLMDRYGLTSIAESTLRQLKSCVAVPDCLIRL